MKYRYVVVVTVVLLALCGALAASAAPASQGTTATPAATSDASAGLTPTPQPLPLEATPQQAVPQQAVPQQATPQTGVQSAAPPAPAANFIYYTVVRGDTLAKIARRFNTSINAILRANPGIRNPNRIYTGQRLYIPVGSPPTFSNVKIALIALNSGGNLGCGDSVVLVNRPVAPTTAPLTAAIRELLSIKERDYGQSGLTHILSDSDLEVQNVTIGNGHADIYLTGNLSLGGVCDSPRVIAQFESTAKQFSTVQSVAVFINGILLQNLLSGQGL